MLVSGDIMFKTFKLSAAVCIALSAALAAVAVVLLSGFSVSREKKPVMKEDSTSRVLPILMYHSVVNDPSLRGDYVITCDDLEQDIRWLTQNGYTPVFCNELPQFVSGSGKLPEKPVILSFDDGCYNNFYYVLPILEKYKVKAVFAVVGEWTVISAEEAEPSPVYSSMDTDNLRSLVYSGYCELANHTCSMHSLGEEGGRRGVLPFAGEDDRDYRRALWGDLTDCAKVIKAAGQQPTTLAYPYGFYTEQTEQLVKELGYTVTLSCEERVNTVSVGDYECLSGMGRFNRPADTTAEQIITAFAE